MKHMKSNNEVETKNIDYDELIDEMDIKEDDLEIDSIISDITKIKKEDRDRILKMNQSEVRMIVDFYYQIQSTRMRLANQLRAIKKQTDVSTEENENITYQLFNNIVGIESDAKKILDYSSGSTKAGQWLRQVMGIGPVLSAALLSAFDITKAPTAGHFWSYAGLNDNNKPWLGNNKATDIVNTVMGDKKKLTVEMIREIAKVANYREEQLINAAMNDKGSLVKKDLISFMSKPPYNLSLKTICWKCGEQFMKLANNPKSLYGKIYRERKEFEHAKNKAGFYKDQADVILKTKNFSNKDIEAIYKSGMLPDGHILARAKRFAVKLFISHLFEAMYYFHYNKPAPNPYIIAMGDHAHYVSPEVDYDTIG